MPNITCSDGAHGVRAGQAGHRTTLGTVPDGQTAPRGMVCEACARALEARPRRPSVEERLAALEAKVLP